uniref:Uncharacterized protein n=1 Tax=Gopherus evgoodei TaxID=1825980 RepID=A0A8C4VME7_9SAUR
LFFLFFGLETLSIPLRQFISDVNSLCFTHPKNLPIALSAKCYKKPGSDNITTEWLQAGEEHTVDVIRKLFNKQEQVPSEWEIVIIVPIYKKGDKSDCKNYREISLLSMLGEALNKMLHGRVKRYLMRNKPNLDQDKVQ